MSEAKNIPLSLWTRYGDMGASSRLRFKIYADALKESGFDVRYFNFFDDAYLKRLYHGGTRSRSSFFKSSCRRLKELMHFDRSIPMYIEYELLPFMPYAVEKSFLKGRKYVLGFDDAVHLRYEKFPLLKHKYPELLRHAAGVITANDALKEEFSRYCGNIIKIPTVPPPESLSADVEKFPRFTVVWIGTPVTGTFLHSHAEHLRAMAQVCDFELLVIASKDFPGIPGVDMRCVDWSQASEMELLRRSHVGIMPLDDTPFAKGKSAYKLIQYLRAGIPAIATPLGENLNVLRHGETGFLASAPQDYAEALQKLANKEQYERICANIGTFAAEYSFESCAGKLTEFLHRCFQ